MSDTPTGPYTIKKMDPRGFAVCDRIGYMDAEMIRDRLNAQHAEIERLKAGLSDEQIAAGLLAAMGLGSEWMELGISRVPKFRRGAFGETTP